MFRILLKQEYCRQSKRMRPCMKLDFDLGHCFKFKSHYSSLGLDSSATLQDIKSAYYQLSLKYHPDKNEGSRESVEKFREITEAYEVLGNVEKKRIYDISLNTGYSKSEWRRQNYSPRSDQFKGRTSARTGRSKYYDYDEHYRQHYEEYNKQRQADYDYFRQRWEADYRRRSPFGEKPTWTSYQKPQPPYPPFNWKFLWQNKSFVYFMTVWIVGFLLTLPFADDKDTPAKRARTVYYTVNKPTSEE